MYVGVNRRWVPLKRSDSCHSDSFERVTVLLLRLRR